MAFSAPHKISQEAAMNLINAYLTQQMNKKMYNKTKYDLKI
jgi:hypothetical protein